MSEPLLRANISVTYPGKHAVLTGIDIEVRAGEITGLVGESGSGKSTLALAIMRLLGSRGACVTGEIAFGGRNLLDHSESEMRKIRGREIALALQSAAAALNPALRIETQLRQAWKAHARSGPGLEELAKWMRSVELPGDEAFLRRFPRQISAGQAQRVVIAMAIMHRPAVLIVDEPTSALDVINQAQILKLFQSLNREYGMSILYISHDLLSVASLCNRMYVLRHGSIVESGPAETVFNSPRHPYSRSLIEAIPARAFDTYASKAGELR